MPETPLTAIGLPAAPLVTGKTSKLPDACPVIQHWLTEVQVMAPRLEATAAGVPGAPPSTGTRTPPPPAASPMARHEPAAGQATPSRLLRAESSWVAPVGMPSARSTTVASL